MLLLAVSGELAGGLAGAGGPAADHVDAGADLVGGGLSQRRTAAGAAEFGVDYAVWLAGAMAPGADQAVEFLAERGERLAAYRGGSPLGVWGCGDCCF
jgi:hypothetical protein